MDKPKPIIITGQTGTGKTSLALKLAEIYNAELISADSRQVYSGLDIGTGKYDHPSDLVSTQGEWYLKNVKIRLINNKTPEEIYGAGEFAADAQKIIEQSQKQQIIVGGTGFYIKSLIDPDETVRIPINTLLRSHYESLENTLEGVEFVKQLQSNLEKIDPVKLQTMNNSDRNNPRRLVRALEVAEWKQHNPLTTQSKIVPTVLIGLHASKEILQEKITDRVNEMMNNGYEDEVKKLLDHYSWNTPGLQTIGYKEWKDYFDKKIDKKTLTNTIIMAHLQYARRQMIYLKRLKQIKWFNISDPSWQIDAIEYLNHINNSVP